MVPGESPCGRISPLRNSNFRVNVIRVNAKLLRTSRLAGNDAPHHLHPILAFCLES